ncbi:hypothetical protein SAY87_016057 [Trapa incisa]|uniref:Homeobox-leucine zipper protein n=2 Tax=Trapa TaxID=22665 RepID=A0AAN7LUI7_TRANT|nr:hypothetical protein SAY87_016057 [Trapa incisa]KAK4786156.1 hypothetical protein SAY86_002845 [Trapa natans]
MANQPSRAISSCLHLKTKMPSFSTTTTEALDTLWVPSPSPAFHESMVNLEEKSIIDDEDESYDECRDLQYRSKKRRLSPSQVQSLERSFDEESRLQPERKTQLAKELGLQPRQVAIWFQNRRARFKTKQLEKEYSQLKDRCDKLKADCNCLVKEKEQLKEELLSLKDKLLRWKEKPNLSSDPDPLEPVSSGNNNISEEEQRSKIAIAKQLSDKRAMLGCKQNHDEGSALRRSDALNLGSPYFTYSDGQALMLGHDSSDFSQDEGDNLDFPKPEHVSSYSAVNTNNGEFGMTSMWEDQHLWSWPC